MGTRGHTKYMVEEIREMMDPEVIKTFKHLRCFNKLLLNCTRAINQAIDSNTSILDEDHSYWDNVDRLLRCVQSNKASNIILNAFLWDESPEGKEYWNKIFNKVNLVSNTK